MHLHRLRQLMLLCLMVLVPLQGLAIKAGHACPLLQQLHPAKPHNHPTVSMTTGAGHATSPTSIPAARCVVHGSIAWLAMPEASPRAPVVPALRLPPPAGAHFSSFIPQQPHRPPLFLSA